MALLFTEQEVRARARQIKGPYGKILREASESFSEAKTYDIFLSHSIKDQELIVGIKAILEDLKYSVYVDWIEDPQLDRSKVTPATASKLRGRMNSSKSLLYVTTENAENSKWMPWECGYFDGLKEKVAIVPVKTSAVSAYAGQEYLGLYPYCVKKKSNEGNDALWVFKDANTYINYDEWIRTKNASIWWKTTSALSQKLHTLDSFRV